MLRCWSNTKAFVGDIIYIIASLRFCCILYSTPIVVVGDYLKSILEVLDESRDACPLGVLGGTVKRGFESVNVNNWLSGSNHTVVELLSD